VGRELLINYLNDKNVRIGKQHSKLNINTSGGNHQLCLGGAALISSFIEATNFITTSDMRIKSNVQDASVAECTDWLPVLFQKSTIGLIWLRHV
jgi:hypothetical protein